jgi:hypothetical protein
MMTARAVSPNPGGVKANLDTPSPSCRDSALRRPSAARAGGTLRACGGQMPSPSSPEPVDSVLELVG